MKKQMSGSPSPVGPGVIRLNGKRTAWRLCVSSTGRAAWRGEPAGTPNMFIANRKTSASPTHRASVRCWTPVRHASNSKRHMRARRQADEDYHTCWIMLDVSPPTLPEGKPGFTAWFIRPVKKQFEQGDEKQTEEVAGQQMSTCRTYKPPHI